METERKIKMAKNFSNNPAFDMLSSYTEKENENAEKTAKKTNPKTNTAKAQSSKTEKPKTFEPIKKEQKSKRLNLLLKPSIYEKLEAKAKEFNLSMNELVNQIIDGNL